jgi:hypothetical protein
MPRIHLPKPLHLILVIVLAVIAIVATVFWQQQNIFDEIRLYHYHPPVAIANLAQEDTFTPYAKTLLYINHPLLLTSHKTFSEYCPNGGDQTIVLGCYHGVQNGIFIYAVSDPQLNGVEQVTVAHEMLHAAYDRLSASKRNQVNGWVENYYQHDEHNPRILAEIAGYKATEPGGVLNEMHSVFGTEVANLPAPLANYYRQYFTNRQTIVNYANNYEQTFTTREAVVSQDDAQLAKLKPMIIANEAQLQSQAQSLSTQLSSLNQLEAGSDLAAYNAAVPGYNAGIVAYNNLLTTTKNLITQYNQLVTTANAAALQAQNLQNELSGQLTALSQQ